MGPWLIEATWSVLTKNQTLKTFKAAFERFWRDRTGNEVTLAVGVGGERRRPDFTLVATGQQLYFVEIKASGHAFNDADARRLFPYAEALEEFFEANKEFKLEFPLGYRIELISDQVSLKEAANKLAFRDLEQRGRLRRSSWLDFLQRAKKAHELFLQVSEEAAKRAR